jgi:hypothetical protein
MPGKPPVKGRQCERCGTWYRPSKYRSAGAMLEYCSEKCKKKALAESVIRHEIMRDW